jgi:hypothetical protein
MVKKWYTGDMNPLHSTQDQYAYKVFNLAGICNMTGVSISKCEDYPSPKGVKAGCTSKNEVYYTIDCGCYRVNLVLSTHLPIDRLSIEFLKIDLSKTNYQKIDLSDKEIAAVRAVFPSAKIITFANEGYDPDVRGLELLYLDRPNNPNAKIDDSASKKHLADTLQKTVDLMKIL